MHCKASEYPGEQIVERFQIEQFKSVSERESSFPVQHGITFDIDGVKDLQAVLASYLLPKLQGGALRRILFLGTGAMMSPASIQQGEAIPAIGHLIRLRAPRIGE